MNGIKQRNGKTYVIHHLKRELKGHMCACEKNRAIECDRKKSNVFNWPKKTAQPSPQKFNGPSLTIDL